jgi:hypothetical protein
VGVAGGKGPEPRKWTGFISRRRVSTTQRRVPQNYHVSRDGTRPFCDYASVTDSLASSSHLRSDPADSIMEKYSAFRVRPRSLARARRIPDRVCRIPAQASR